MTEPLFSAEVVRPAAGPVELATARSLEAAQLDAQDEGAGHALLTLAWALDAARSAGKFYGVAQAAPAYLEQARALGLTLDARKEATSDPFAWLDGLASPTMGNTPQS